ncbi:phosphatidate cytidylyltransferase [Sphingomonas abietis]|uniref:Phosphatidate cytidylyltransferase n=1 Tax=Sphingomonas abietis TaxID=3012344 RepID=A0ABY7NXV7_9SPHN|nr:phosphatidate cytidylyltransferase [Sphingomonas abietis]WBO24186.1 phosphatidate cytidylyltransferase [Sphingomonas abietis]
MTGIVLIVVAVGCLVYGGEPFWMLLSLAALIMMAEWAGLIRAPRWQAWLAIGGLLLPVVLAEPHVDLPAKAAWYALLAVTLVVGIASRNLRLAAGMLYAGLPVLSLFYIHDQYDGIDLSFWSLAIVWATDIGAYFSGRTFGGPKLAPIWSPNKTWSGLIGGMACATIVGFALTTVLHVQLRLAALSALLAVAAQMGDLFESQMKRRAGVKDSGKLLPGHGGVMDRLDGAVPVLCIVALIVASGLL